MNFLVLENVRVRIYSGQQPRKRTLSQRVQYLLPTLLFVVQGVYCCKRELSIVIASWHSTFYSARSLFPLIWQEAATFQSFTFCSKPATRTGCSRWDSIIWRRSRGKLWFGKRFVSTRIARCNMRVSWRFKTRSIECYNTLCLHFLSHLIHGPRKDEGTKLETLRYRGVW